MHPAVILPKGYNNIQLNDSKKISEKIRTQLRIDIENKATAIGIGIVDEKKIDQINILQAFIGNALGHKEFKHYSYTFNY